MDGAIHDAAGEELFNACLKVPEVRPGVRCPTGEARITPGFRLPAKFVIHTVGPVYYGGQRGESEKLAACCRTIAFPCISTGVYGYPLEAAAKIAIREVSAFLETHPEMEVTFCCFSKWDAEVYERLMRDNQ